MTPTEIHSRLRQLLTEQQHLYAASCGTGVRLPARVYEICAENLRLVKMLEGAK